MNHSSRSLVFQNASVLIFEPELSLHHQIRGPLGLYRFDPIHMLGSTAQVEEILEKNNVDLLIVDALEGGVELIRKIRNNDVGKNLCVPIIATTGDATQAGVNKLVANGADSVLIKPYSPQQILQQITNLTKRRNRFVVTSSYIGPDRRKSPERDDKAPVVKSVEVPNPLALKVPGQAEEQAEIERRIQEARHELLTLRLEENGVQLQMQLRLAMDADDPTTLKRHIDWLLRVASDTRIRVREFEMDDQLVECEKLIDIVERAAGQDEAAAKRALESVSARIVNMSQGLTPDIPEEELDALVVGNIERYKAWLDARQKRHWGQENAKPAGTHSSS